MHNQLHDHEIYVGTIRYSIMRLKQVSELIGLFVSAVGTIRYSIMRLKLVLQRRYSEAVVE